MEYKQMTLQIGEQDFVLNIEAMCFYDYFKEKTGQDYFEFLDTVSKNLSGTKEFIQGVVYAGMMAHSEISETNHTLSKEEVDKHIRRLRPQDINKIMSDYNSLQEPEKEGESGGQTKTP